jgi:microcompartment protein CcmL/EutN
VALALVEFGSIAAGMHAGDAMAKKAPIDRVVAGTVHPGKYLVLISGSVADVEESLKAGRAAGSTHVIDFVFLPQVHPSVVEAIAASAVAGHEREGALRGPALGVIETSSVAAAIHAADAGVKGADVSLLELRLADGLHGKGLVLYTGAVHDVEAAVDIGTRAIDGSLLVNQIVIPQLHGEMGTNILIRTRFGENVASSSERAVGGEY